MRKPVNFEKIDFDQYHINGITVRIKYSEMDMHDTLPFAPIAGSTVVWLYPQGETALPTAIIFEWDGWSTRCNIQIRFCHRGMGFDAKSVVGDSIPRSSFNTPANTRYYISTLIAKYWKNFTAK